MLDLETNLSRAIAKIEQILEKEENLGWQNTYRKKYEIL